MSDMGTEKSGISFAQVTVEESLMFSAQLRLMDVSKRDLRTFVNEVTPSAGYASLTPTEKVPLLQHDTDGTNSYKC